MPTQQPRARSLVATTTRDQDESWRCGTDGGLEQVDADDSSIARSLRSPRPQVLPEYRPQQTHLSTLEPKALRIRHLSAHMPEAFELCGWVRVLFTSSLGPASNARKGRTPPGQQKGHNFPNPESDTRRAKDQDEQNPRWTRTTRRCELTRHRNPLGH